MLSFTHSTEWRLFWFLPNHLLVYSSIRNGKLAVSNTHVVTCMLQPACCCFKWLYLYTTCKLNFAFFKLTVVKRAGPITNSWVVTKEVDIKSMVDIMKKQSTHRNISHLISSPFRKISGVNPNKWAPVELSLYHCLE